MLEGETMQIMRNMGILFRLHKVTAEKETEDGGLYRSQMMVLAWLSKADVPRSQKEIADRFGISKPAVTEMVKRLEELGMVTRTPSSEDGRVRLIELTEKGRRLTERTRENFMRMNERMSEGVPDEDMEVFSRVLEKMIANLRALEAEQNGR